MVSNQMVGELVACNVYEKDNNVFITYYALVTQFPDPETQIPTECELCGIKTNDLIPNAHVGMKVRFWSKKVTTQKGPINIYTGLEPMEA